MGVAEYPTETTWVCYTPHNEFRGVYWIHPVCLSVCPSVCPLTFRVRPVASTVQDGFLTPLRYLRSNPRFLVLYVSEVV